MSDLNTYLKAMAKGDKGVEDILSRADKLISSGGVATEEDRVKAAKEINRLSKTFLNQAIPDEDTISREYESMNRRLQESRNNIIIYSLLAKGGVQGANQSLSTETEKYSTLQYLRDKIKDNPKGYAVEKIDTIIEKVIQPLQTSGASLATAMTHGYADSAQGAAALSQANLEKAKLYMSLVPGEEDPLKKIKAYSDAIYRLSATLKTLKESAPTEEDAALLYRNNYITPVANQIKELMDELKIIKQNDSSSLLNDILGR